MLAASSGSAAKNQDIFSRGGELGELMRAIDWSKNPLGPVEKWPSSLRSMVNVCLTSRFPIILFCGPEFIVLYNDAYIPIFGKKHPKAALGLPGKIAWSEIWHIIGSMLEGVRSTGNPTWSDDLLLITNSAGFPEENYFTFSYSPVGVSEGEVNAIFTAVLRSTERVIGERRLQTLKDLSAVTTEAKTIKTACANIMEALRQNNADIPFALFYLLDAERQNAFLAGTVGISRGASTSPDTISLKTTEEKPLWPLIQVAHSGKMEIIDITQFPPLPKGRWDKPPHKAVILPIAAPGQERPIGMLIAGANPLRALDESCITFYNTAASHIATAIAHTRAYEEERRRAEALAEIDRAKTVFFSNVSHEFRTPLTLILGPLEDVLDDKQQVLPPRHREQIEIIYRNALRLLKLVNALLDFSRLEAGRAQVCYAPTALAQVTTELIGVFRAAIEKGGLALNIDITPLDEPVYIDLDMWEKVVFNLLSNALKYTHKGNITVSLKKQEKMVELSVADTGTGIPEEELPHMFERFHQVKGAHGRSHEGTGIGLALTQELVKLHGGSLRVASKLGEGSVFTVAIPLGSAHLPQQEIKKLPDLISPVRRTRTVGAAYVEEALRWLPEDKETEQKQPTTLEAKARPKANILLADDNTDMRKYVQRLLSEHWNVQAVADGEAALQAALEKKPDLILSDVMMPKLDGFGLVCALRSEPKTKTVPIILLSARTGEEARVGGLQRGADDYLIKPFSAKELLTRVKIHLELGHLRTDLEKIIDERTRELQTLAEISPSGIFRLNEKGETFYVNQKGCEVLDLPADKAKGMVWTNILHPDDKARVLTVWQDYKEGKINRFKEEYRFLRPDGSIVWVIGQVVAERNAQNQILSYVGTVTDITELKALEKARLEAVKQAEEQQRQRAQEAEAYRKRQEQFIDTMCHELRNPLSGIYGNVSLLESSAASLEHLLQTAAPEKLDAGLREEIFKYLNQDKEAREAIDKCAKHQKVITDDILNLSRLEAGKIDLNPTDFNPHRVVKETVSMLESEMNRKHIRLYLNLPPTKIWVKSDPHRLAQVLLNLLSNAIKFTLENGEITISLSQIEETALHSVLQFTIADTGVGMTAEEQAKLFQRFTQANRRTHEQYGGSGLGLAISKNLIELMGGKIGVESKKWEGTKFTFTVKCDRATKLEQEQKPVLVTAAEPGLAFGEGPHILVVEDNIINQKVLVKNLEKAGYKCTTAKNGQEALELQEKVSARLIFMDIEMPVMNGLEATKAIRQKEQQSSRPPVPIIGLSGNARPEQREEALQAGMNDYLTKPYEIKKLIEKIAQYMPPHSPTPPVAPKAIATRQLLH